MEKVSKKKICLICSSGGHMEQIKQLKQIINDYDCFFVTNKNKAMKADKKKMYFVDDLLRNKNKIRKAFRLLRMFVQQLHIYFKEKPDVIITTGAGVAIPMCLIGHFFKKKVIYIESFARMNSINKSGKFLYKYADLFIVQWENLLEKYPKAVYGGWLY